MLYIKERELLNASLIVRETTGKCRVALKAKVNEKNLSNMSIVKKKEEQNAMFRLVIELLVQQYPELKINIVLIFN